MIWADTACLDIHRNFIENFCVRIVFGFKALYLLSLSGLSACLAPFPFFPLSNYCYYCIATRKRQSVETVHHFWLELLGFHFSQCWIWDEHFSRNRNLFSPSPMLLSSVVYVKAWKTWNLYSCLTIVFCVFDPLTFAFNIAPVRFCFVSFNFNLFYPLNPSSTRHIYISVMR